MQDRLEFPAAINLLDVKPFDYCKIVDLVVRAMPKLDPKMKSYLLCTQERCIESLAWLPGSSIYTAIKKTCVTESVDQAPAEDESAPFFSPATESTTVLSPVLRSPTSAFKIVVPSSQGTSQ